MFCISLSDMIVSSSSDLDDPLAVCIVTSEGRITVILLFVSIVFDSVRVVSIHAVVSS